MQSENSRIGYRFLSATGLAEPKKPGEQEPVTKICGICEPNQKMIMLPQLSDISIKPALLWETLENRETYRTYADLKITRDELSLMLHYTQGVRGKSEGSHFRTVPSAGALHPFETRLVINRVEGIEPGIYRYLPIDHALVREVCHSGDQDAVASVCKNPGLVSGSAVTFLWTAIPLRMVWKFGSRGWRYLFIEAGHICQNLYIIGAGLGLGVCAIGSYRDDELHCILGIDGESEFCVYMASVGRKKI